MSSGNRLVLTRSLSCVLNSESLESCSEHEMTRCQLCATTERSDLEQLNSISSSRKDTGRADAPSADAHPKQTRAECQHFRLDYRPNPFGGNKVILLNCLSYRTQPRRLVSEVLSGHAQNPGNLLQSFAISWVFPGPKLRLT